jgi:hypothetical protein
MSTSAPRPDDEPATPPARIRKIPSTHRARLHVLTLFKALDYNPLISMHDMATAMTKEGAFVHEPQLRAKIHAELAEYAYPKLRSMDVPPAPDPARRSPRTFDLSRLTLDERRDLLRLVERTALVAPAEPLDG